MGAGNQLYIPPDTLGKISAGVPLTHHVGIAGIGAAAMGIANKWSASGTCKRKVPTITKDTSAKRKRTSVKQVVNKQNISESSMTDANANACIGANSLLIVGNNREPAVALKLGKHVRAPESVSNMLKHCLGHGSVVNSWGGRMVFDKNVRHRHYELFRHRAADWGDDIHWVKNGPYNPEFKVLKPYSGNYQVASQLYASTGFHNMNSGSAYISPLNRADYEDMSWNLNKLRLLPSSGDTTGAVLMDQEANDGFKNQQVNDMSLGYLQDEPILQFEAHRGMSAIMRNNSIAASVSDQSAETYKSEIYKANAAPYRYNMVFNNGIVSYDFANKGLGPAVVEIVVYKVKKGANQSSWLGPAFVGDQDKAMQHRLEDPIKESYLNTCFDAFGTDQLEGRIPQATDVVTNPRFPFLPELKKAKAADQSVSEHSRMKFALAAGGRRHCTITLGGDKYDPMNIQQTQPTGLSGGVPTSGPTAITEANFDQVGNVQTWPVCDNHSFIIAIACNGIKMSALHAGTTVPVDPDTGANLPLKNEQPSEILGDIYSEGNVQYYAKYEEKIAACAYKDPSRKNLFVAGGNVQLEDWKGEPGVDIMKHVEPTTILGSDRAVRIARHVTSTKRYDASSGVVQTVDKTEVGQTGTLGTEANLNNPLQP